MEKEYEVAKLKRNKLIIVWGVYLLVVAGLVKMSMIITGGSSDPAMIIATLCFFAIPLSLVLLVFPLAMLRNIRNGCTRWREIQPIGRAPRNEETESFFIDPYSCYGLNLYDDND